MNVMKSVWVWAIVGAIALGVWWYAANQPLDSSTNALLRLTSGRQTGGSAANPAVRAGAVNKKSSDVVSIAESIPEARIFASWLSSTGVASQIKGEGPYTIFVPTDGAISELPHGTFTGLSAAQQKRFVENHVVAGRAIDVTAEDAGVMTTLSGDALNFSYGPDRIPMVGSAIVISQYDGGNGIVYLIDNALIPPQ